MTWPDTIALGVLDARAVGSRSVEPGQIHDLAPVEQVGVPRIDQDVGVVVDELLPGGGDGGEAGIRAVRLGPDEVLGITPRTLYRFMNEGQLAGYRFGRVIRLKATDIDEFIEQSRISPGELDHLYPDTSAKDSSAT
jgi:excisionase family DNA binding protein